MKYIDAGTTAEKISNEFEIPMSELCDVFADIPSADVQPVKRGRWAKDEKGTFHHCSECGGESFRDVDCWGLEYQEYCTDYCPHCGARMDGGTDDENS